MLNYGLQCSVMNLLLNIPLQRVQTSCFLAHRVLLARPTKEDSNSHTATVDTDVTLWFECKHYTHSQAYAQFYTAYE